MSAPNFELITELQVTLRRDFPLAVPGILNPMDAQPLVEGEWLELDANYLLKRGSVAGGGVNGAVFPVHTERGRYDTQAVQKANVIFAGQYEAETKIFDTGGTYNPGTELMVDDVTIGGIVRRGLKPATAGHIVVGHVSKLTGSGASAKLRFIHGANYMKA